MLDLFDHVQARERNLTTRALTETGPETQPVPSKLTEICQRDLFDP